MWRRRAVPAAVVVAALVCATAASAHAAVGLAKLRIVDRHRSVPTGHGRRGPRTIETEIRYPALGPAWQRELPNAPPRPGARLPVVVFAHGYAVSPETYARLLDAWAAAGFVVAAPVFPRTSSGAPGGPDRSDLPNQPADMRLVISRVVTAARAGSATRWAALVDGHRIAVAGHSDGGITALATAYDRRERDSRVSAAVILAGPFLSSYHWSAPGGREPPLLAVQGTADHTNAPANASAYFGLATAPKYLLWLVGADHLPPFTRQQPQLGLVERATIAFLDRYLKGDRPAQRRLLRAGHVRGRTRLVAQP